MPITATNIYSEEQIKKQIVKAPPLPAKLLYLPNNDKSFHERWETGRDMLNIPHPFRAVLLGRPNVGKTNIIINLILRCNFEEIFVIHRCPYFIIFLGIITITMYYEYLFKITT